jgi:hypothetical protein
MAILPLLTWDMGYSGSNVRAYRLLNGTTLESSQLGGDTGFSATSRDLGADGSLPSRRIIEFKGDLYAIHSTKIYRLSLGTNPTWTEVFTLVLGPSTSDDQVISGFHIADVEGDLRLFIFYQRNSSSNCYGAYSSDGTSWTTTPLYANGNSWPHSAIYFKGRFYFIGTSSANPMYWYNPTTNAWGAIANLGALVTGQASAVCNFKGRLLYIGPTWNGTRGNPIFKELVSGSLVDASFSGGANAGDFVTRNVASQSVNCFPFEYQDKLYVIYSELTTSVFNGANDGQMQVVQFTPNGSTEGSSWAEEDISSTVVPSSWLTGGAFDGDFDSRMAMGGYVQISDPENPEVFFWRYTQYEANGSPTFWTWNGPTSLMTVAAAAGLDRGFSLPLGCNVTGEVVYTEGDFDVSLENPVTRPGYIDFDFQIHDPLDGSSIPNKSARLYYSIGGSNWTLATISTLPGDAPEFVNPTSAGTDPAPTITTDSVGTVLQDIPVGHKFTATWDSTADGFTAAGARFELMLEIF